MASGKLTPLGDPAPNAPKWFAAMEVVSLAAGNGLRAGLSRSAAWFFALRPFLHNAPGWQQVETSWKPRVSRA